MEAGFNSVRVSFGDVFIHPQAGPDGAYQQGIIVTLVVSIPEAVAWTGVDSSLGNEAAVAMVSDRSVGVQVVGPALAPTATPIPVPTPTNTPTPTPAPTPIPGPIATPIPTPTFTPTPTPTPIPVGNFTDSGQSLGSVDTVV